MKRPEEELDVIIVGGGPAGLSAALLLGRCCRRVMLFDTNEPRNRFSKEMHGFLSRDRIAPAEMRRICFEQLKPYSSVQVCEKKIVAARSLETGFEVSDTSGQLYRARKLLLATGVKDLLPEIPNIKEFYGTSVFHCPICDGWEQRDRPLAVLGNGGTACHYLLELFCWSREIVFCSNGPHQLEREHREMFRRIGIRIIESKIIELVGEEGRLREIRFEDENAVPCQALFFCSEEVQQCNLAKQLGVQNDKEGRSETDRMERTRLPGLYIAGNTSSGVQLAIVAAAEGAKAAFAINEELNEENLARLGTG